MKFDIVCGIYYIRNKVNGKLYIGQSVNIYNEWNTLHISTLRNNKHHNRLLNADWQEFGENNFEHGIIEECEKDDLDSLEIEYIKVYKSFHTDGGYNLSAGGNGEGFRGKKHSEESKRKNSEAHKGKPSKNIGRKHRPESIQKMSESKKGKPSGRLGMKATDEQRKKNSESHMGQVAWNKGKKATEQARKNQSLAQMGKPSGHKGKKHTEKTKKIISEKLKEIFSNTTNGMFGKTHTEESKKKISESHKGKPAKNKGVPASEESKIKNSEKHMGKQTIKDKSNCKSKYFGVVQSRKLWWARVTKNKITYDLGKFELEIEAAKAYDKKAYELYGKDAKLNFPEDYQ